jgi:hypothetical protein
MGDLPSLGRGATADGARTPSVWRGISAGLADAWLPGDLQRLFSDVGVALSIGNVQVDQSTRVASTLMNPFDKTLM